MKNELERPVSDWMVSPVFTLREHMLLAEAAKQFEALGVSALPVLDASSRLTGLLSWVELRRAGRLVYRTSDHARHLRLPEGHVGEFMNPRVPVIRRDLSLGACARRMQNRRLHRLYVAEDGPLEGVVSTREMLQAVVRAQLEVTLGSLARRSVATISAQETLATATARLWADPTLNLVVTRDGVPVGVLAPEVALTSRQADPDEAVALWMDASFLSLPAELSAGRGAQRLLDLKGRYIVAHEGSAVTGLISGLDFAELVAESSPG